MLSNSRNAYDRSRIVVSRQQRCCYSTHLILLSQVQHVGYFAERETELDDFQLASVDVAQVN